MKTILTFCCLFFSLLHGKTYTTFFGDLEIEEQVLIDLIECPAMQRLKGIHQYGVAYYTTHQEEYNRFDHSMGVFAILRKNNASLEEQISGLLHDISHTVFSHVGDWVFGKECQEEDYQNTIHKLYFCHSGVEKILLAHGYTVNAVQPKSPEFIMLEQPLPDLCADRIDYNIQGAYYRGFITKDEALELYSDFRFENGKWISSRADLLSKLVYFSIFMSQDCWGSATNYACSRWLADAILRGIDIGLVSWSDIHFGVDDDVWQKLAGSNDPHITRWMQMLANPGPFHRLVSPYEATLMVKFRYRGIDPLVLYDNAPVRLSSIDSEVAHAFTTVKEKAAIGWPLQFVR